MQQLSQHAPYVIIDARPRSQYLAGHIPGAAWMHWDTWCEKPPIHAETILMQPGYWGILKDIWPATLREQLQQIGLSDNRPVLVYADGPRSKGREGRIAWMLLYWGISSVSLLDGGWSAWLNNGGSISSIESSTPAPKTGQLHLRLQEQRRIRLSQLKQDYYENALPILIDVRTRPEFEGQHNPYQPRLGRLPGAVHLPFAGLFDEAGNYLTKIAYLQRLPPQIYNTHRVVAYCEVGVRSCLFALLHEAYAGQIIANFDGSIMEWALDKQLPMECNAD